MRSKRSNFNLWIVGNIDFPQGRGGTPRIRNIGIGLTSLGNKVTLLIPHAAGYVGKNQNVQTYGNYRGIEFKYFTKTTERPSSEAQVALQKIVGNFKLAYRFLFVERPDIILIFNNYSLLDVGLPILFAKMTGRKIVFDVCDERFELYATNRLKSIFRWINAIQIKISDRILFQYADGFLVVSQFLQKKILRLYSGQKILNVPLIAEIPNKISKPLIFPERRLDRSFPKLAYVGSLIADEGIDLLIESVSILKMSFNSISCYLIGDANNSSYKAVIEKMIDEKSLKNNIIFMGALPYEQLIGLLSEFDLLVLPRPDSVISRAGFPGKLAEYFGSKRPVVTTNFGDIGIYFTDKKNILMSANNSAKSFATTIKESITKKKYLDDIGEEGYLFALEKFDIRKVAITIHDYFIDLIIK